MGCNFSWKASADKYSQLYVKTKENKFVLGITGSIACGKSTVAEMFRTQGCLLIDADRLGHNSLSAGSSVYKKLKQVFGKTILKPDSQIDRGKLAKIVFANQAALAKLNGIVHPVLIKRD